MEVESTLKIFEEEMKRLEKKDALIKNINATKNTYKKQDYVSEFRIIAAILKALPFSTAVYEPYKNSPDFKVTIDGEATYLEVKRLNDAMSKMRAKEREMEKILEKQVTDPIEVSIMITKPEKTIEFLKRDMLNLCSKLAKTEKLEEDGMVIHVYKRQKYPNKKIFVAGGGVIYDLFKQIQRLIEGANSKTLKEKLPYFIFLDNVIIPDLVHAVRGNAIFNKNFDWKSGKAEDAFIWQDKIFGRKKRNDGTGTSYTKITGFIYERYNHLNFLLNETAEQKASTAIRKIENVATIEI